MAKHFTFLTSLCLVATASVAQTVTVKVNAQAGRQKISPYIYGKNGGSSDKPSEPTSNEELTRIKDAGIRFLRQNNGNNSTKYNWRKKLTSHPDWYNNVHACDWDYSAQTIQSKLPGVQGMYAFQLLGRVADNNSHNFNDWEYNHSAWWSGCSQNLAGGGTPNANGDKAAVEGDATLYTEEWPADSTVAILTHWSNDLGLNLDQFRYWNMDNEMEIWTGTHDDVMKAPDAEGTMQKYFAVAKAARKLWPEVKLCGPVACSEWMWYLYSNKQVEYEGKNYPWLEYFIMRCAKEQKETGVKMLDVFDIHNYPNEKTDAEKLQTHRMYYDLTYDYPGANGVKTINGGWDNNQTKEYIFVRVQQWLDKYFGEGHGITVSISEFNVLDASATVNALVYASHLGELGWHGAEFFTPWTWKTGMWEAVHLFSRYSKSETVASVSSQEDMLSAYSSINATSDSLTIVVINRELTQNRDVEIEIAGIAIPDGEYEAHLLAKLPEDETFNSETDNALTHTTVSVKDNKLTFAAPALSMAAIELVAESADVPLTQSVAVAIYPNPAVSGRVNIKSDHEIGSIEIFSASGSLLRHIDGNNTLGMTISTTGLPAGIYMVKTTSTTGDTNISRLSVK